MGSKALPIHTHRDNLAALGPGDTCYVRWVDGDSKRWYRCSVVQNLPGRCIVVPAEGIANSNCSYEVSWEMDEALAKPSHAAVEFICNNPGAVCIELAQTRAKYLIPHGNLFFADAIGEVLCRAGFSRPPIQPGVTVDAVAATYEFDKIVV